MSKYSKILMCTFFGLLVAMPPAHSAQPGDGIKYEAEFQRVRAQHVDRWKEEDRELRERLAAMEKEHGKRPNIIHIMWDDHSLGQVGIPEMNKVLGFDTPNINQMSDEGIAFTRMYSEPSCTPTRTAALTGRLAVRAGMYKVGFPPDGMGLHKDEITIAEVLGKVGYKTAFVGKGHQGDIKQSYLNHQGFDYANFSMYNQFPNMTWHEAFAPSGMVQGLFPSQYDKRYTVDQEFRPHGYINQLEGREGEKPTIFTGTSIPEYKKLLRQHHKIVLDYISSAAESDSPFYLAYWPHVYDPVRKAEDLTTSASTWFAQSMVELDNDIGEILQALKAAGMAENTLVVAMADNGPMHELAPLGPQETILRGGKGDFLEGGVRVPAFAWWPGTIEEGQVVGDIVSVHDLFTTFISLANGLDAVPTDRVIDGIDQTALLLKGDGHSRRDYLHIYTGDKLAASMKQQIKRRWIGARPGLMGNEFTDLYKDPREEHEKMPPFLWAWAAFDQMRERHENQIVKYPLRKPTQGVPYEGVKDLPEEAKRLAKRVSDDR